MRLTSPFHHIGGRCYSIALDPDLFPDSDDVSDPSRSSAILSEDGTDLGPPHTAHQLIAQEGGGAYSHWRGVLYFSALDGGNPNENGRIYEIRRDPGKYFHNRAEHAAGIVDSYCRNLPRGRAELQGARVLEIGPGRDMGAVMLMAGLGAGHVTAVDRFVGAWQKDWHEPYLDALATLAADRYAIDIESLAADAKSKRSFTIGPISFFADAFETFGRSGAEFDVTVSHSVFEHFYSVEGAAEALFAVSANGSSGAHHVDFRDHRNFGEPLEFLLLSDREYENSDVNSDYGRGNRMRAAEMTTILQVSGFKNVAFSPEGLAAQDYLSVFEPRLRSSGSRYRDCPRADLAILSGDYVLLKD